MSIVCLPSTPTLSLSTDRADNPSGNNNANNQPVIDREYELPEGRIVSKTDLKGVITYANDSFIEVSGFTEAELVGRAHNIVRHPSMPPAAFEDLWITVKAGKPWRGLVKNRRKNGDHYWVEATVVPIRKNDETVG